MRKGFSICRLHCIAALVISVLTAGAVAADTDARILVVGRITEKADKHYDNLKQVADYVAGQLKVAGIKQGRALITEDVDQMVQHFKEGRVDVVSDTIPNVARLLDEAGAEVLLKTQRKGAATYRAAFFARKDSGIRSLADLRGRIIAFEERLSTMGHIMPAAELTARGFELVRLDSPRKSVPSDKVGYIYSGEEISSAVLVHKGIVHAGAFADADFTNEDSMPTELRGDLKIFHQAREFPRGLIVVRGDLAPALKNRLRDVLLKMPSDARAAPLLKKFHGTMKFERLDKADVAAIDEARRLTVLVAPHLK